MYLCTKQCGALSKYKVMNKVLTEKKGHKDGCQCKKK